MTSKWISPVDRARVPNDILSRIKDLETVQQTQQGSNLIAQNQAEISLDTWALNTSFPSICQGRLTLVSGVPVPETTTTASIIYFTQYKGNLIGIYNGSTWDQIPFSELAIPVSQSQSGTIVSGQATITALTDTSQLIVGMLIGASGIPGTATIQSIDSATQITMTANATGNLTQSTTFRLPPATDIDIFIVNTGGGVLALRMIAWNTRNTATVTNVTNASPMVVTSTLAGISANVGQQVNLYQSGAAGNPGLGTWRVGATTGTTLTLLNSDGTNSAAGGAFVSNFLANTASQTGLARAAALSLQDGIYVLTSDPTWRYLGSAHTSGNANGTATIMMDSITARNLWNYYNRVQRAITVTDTTASWAGSSINTWIPDHNSIANRAEVMIGFVEDVMAFQKSVGAQTASSATAFGGLNLDAATGQAPVLFAEALNVGASSVRGVLFSTLDPSNLFAGANGGIGYHFIQGMEQASSTTNTAFIGNGQHAITGLFFS